MRLLALLFSLLLLANFGRGQDYFPTLTDRATWTIEIGEGMGSFRYITYTLDCDSVLINGKYYQQLLFEDPNTDCEKVSPSYVREDIETRQLFYYSSGLFAGEEVLIADYTLEVGDTLVTYPVFEDEEEQRVVVDSIFAFPFQGQERTFWRFENQAYGYFEGVGNVWGGLLPGCNPNRFAVLHDREDSPVDCDGVVGVDDQGLPIQIAYYPNPARDFLVIDWKNNRPIYGLTYQLFDPLGREVLNGQVVGQSTRIDLSTFPAGTFLLRLFLDGKPLDQQLIIRQP